MLSAKSSLSWIHLKFQIFLQFSFFTFFCLHFFTFFFKKFHYFFKKMVKKFSALDVKINTALRKPKTAKGRRYLKNREPKLNENDKMVSFIRGSQTGQKVDIFLKDFCNSMKPYARIFSRHETRITFPTDSGPTGYGRLEEISEMFDSSLMVFGCKSKKRPFRIIFYRMFGHKVKIPLFLHSLRVYLVCLLHSFRVYFLCLLHSFRVYFFQVLDFQDLTVVNYKSSSEFSNVEKPKHGSKPLVIFQVENYFFLKNNSRNIIPGTFFLYSILQKKL